MLRLLNQQLGAYTFGQEIADTHTHKNMIYG